MTAVSQLPIDETTEEREARVALAATYRLAAHLAMTDLIFSHISLRLPGSDDLFLINPYGWLFEEITASSLVKVDLDGNVVDGTGQRVNPAGFVIHSAIHAGRPDAACVLHLHTRAGCAVAAQSDGLLPVNQMALEFYGRLAYHDYEGVALNLAERERLVADLGANHAMILRNHGLLTVGATPAQAFLRMYALDRACQIQVDALAGDRALTLPSHDVCEHAARQLTGRAGDDLPSDADLDTALAWGALIRLLDRVSPGYDR